MGPYPRPDEEDQANGQPIEAQQYLRRSLPVAMVTAKVVVSLRNPCGIEWIASSYLGKFRNTGVSIIPPIRDYRL